MRDEPSSESEPVSEPDPLPGPGSPVEADPPAGGGASTRDRAGKVARNLGRRAVAHPLGKLAAVTIGVLFGLAVEAGVGSTGILGPGIDQLITEQTAGFAQLEAKLEALRATSDPAESKRLTTEIEGLLAEQRRMSARAADELRGARTEILRLKEEALASKGAASGADLWLVPGESVTVAGQPGQVFAFSKYSFAGSRDDIYANVSGRPQRMRVGDAAEFPGEKGVWRVIFKQGAGATSDRAGFDLVFVPAEG